MTRTCALVAGLVMAAIPASAGQDRGIACPATDRAGHPLRRGATGTLYYGDHAKGDSNAPDFANGKMTLFKLRPEAGPMVLVCNYEGSPIGTAIKVPVTASSCRQDASSFSCR